jgi:hypothetical protein
MVLERWTNPTLSRRACACEYGLRSRRGGPAGVAKRPRELISHPKSPTVPIRNFCIAAPHSLAPVAPGVLSAPVLWVLRALCWVWPAAKLGPPEDPHSSFALREEAERYAACEHNYLGHMRLSTGRMFMDEMFPRIGLALSSGALRADFPFLIVHATGDPVPIAPCHQLMAAACTKDKQLLQLDGSSHQVLSDPGWEEPLEHAVRWIQQRIDGSVPSQTPASRAADQA